MIYIETPRLKLRDWKQTNLEPFIQMNADEEVMKYFPKVLSVEETNIFYQSIISEFKECGFGLYAVEVKENEEFIGFIGFHKASACLQFGFNELGFRDIYSFTADINEPSKNVMRKLGMNFIKSFNHPKVEASNILRKHVLFHIKNTK